MTKPDLTTTSKILGAALVGAAMALPSVQIAYGDAPPEQGIVSFKYLHYQEHQAGPAGSATATSTGDDEHGNRTNNAINLVSGASSAASAAGADADRIRVIANSIYAMTPIAGKWSVGFTYTHDVVSGASPQYHTENLTRMKDTRNAEDIQVTRYFPQGNLSFGTSYSKESDYISRGLSLQGSLSTEDKNTTFTLGGGYSNDTINPSNLVVVDEKKNVVAGIVGVTRVLTKKDIVQLNLGYSHGTGYYSDPYKTPYDNRPRERNSTTVMARWNHHLDFTDGTGRLTYRYYTDTFGIRAHTLEAEYVQPLRNGWTVTPLLRLYTQNEADFYLKTDPAAPTVPSTPPLDAVYFTQDQRMSAFGAVTEGIKVSKQLNKDWLVDVKYEHYMQHSNWGLGGHVDKALNPFSASSIQLGVSRQF